MSSFDDNDRNCGIYRTNDPINNFKSRYPEHEIGNFIRKIQFFSVKSERLTSNSLLPSLERVKIQEELSRLLNNDGQPTKEPKASKTEVAQMFNQTNNSEYEEVVIVWQRKHFKLKEKNLAEYLRIYESDPYCHARHLDYFMIDSSNERLSQLALGINNI
ncbi:unnamed protein product, partial [Rotaria sp. Silwood2]